MGTLDIFNNGSTPAIVFGGNLSGFNGDLNFINGAAFSITTTNLLGATLTFATAAQTQGGGFSINNNVDVTGLVLGGTSLGNGTYTAAQLNTAFGGGSFFTGASDIVVAPEPSVWASMIAGLGILLGFQAARRRTA